MKVLSLVLGLVLACHAKVQWYNICEASGDIAAHCPDLEYGETFGCLSTEYKKKAASMLSITCKDAMRERAEESAEAAMQARAIEASAAGMDWSTACSEDIAAICGGDLSRADTFKCLAEAYKAQSGSLKANCVSAIVARGQAARAQNSKDLWKQACADDIASCGGVSKNSEKLQCLLGKKDSIQDQCAEALDLLYKVLSSSQSQSNAQPAVPPPMTTSAPPVMHGAVAQESKPIAPITPPAEPMGFMPVARPPQVATPATPVTPTPVAPKAKANNKLRCPAASALKAMKCPKKVKVGFAIENGKCKLVKGCRKQKMFAKKKLKFFHTKMACRKALKKCNKA